MSRQAYIEKCSRDLKPDIARVRVYALVTGGNIGASKDYNQGMKSVLLGRQCVGPISSLFCLPSSLTGICTRLLW